MGNCVGGFKRRTRISPWKKSRTIVLCFLGIDGAGKTTVVKALQAEDLGTVHPTVGFSRAEFMLKKYKILAYDLGGGERIREIWPTYYAEVYGIVYVVDSAAISRLAENKRIVDSLVERPELMGKPILFLLNKKDLPEAIDEMQFSDRFELHNMAKINKTDIRVEGICAVKGSGKEIDSVITEGVEWLIERIVENYTNIEKGVQVALKTLQERQAQDRLERQHRLAILAASRADESHSDDKQSDEGDGEIPATTSNNAQENVDGLVQPLANGTAVERQPEYVAKRVPHYVKRRSLPSIRSSKTVPTPPEYLKRRRRGSLSVDYSVFEVVPQPTASAAPLNEASALDSMPNGTTHTTSGEDAIEMTTMATASKDVQNPEQVLELGHALPEKTQKRTNSLEILC